MDNWKTKKKILVILAHPDDPEFFCGGTIAKWTKQGNEVHYTLLTRGEKGINDDFDKFNDIIDIREKEQGEAARVLGVKSITFLNFKDGMIYPDIKARKEVVATIRKIKPDIVVTCDPTNYYMNDNYINHPDHRAAGQIVIDAVFPGTQNKLYFPELLEKGLHPHHVEEVWISLPKEVNVVVDVTDTWKDKISALEKHRSQIGDLQIFRDHMNEKAIHDENGVHYEESFHRIIFRS